MYKNEDLVFDPEHPLQVLKRGTYEQWVNVKGKKRRFLVHIPHGCREAAPGIFVLSPDHQTADDLLQNTCWTWLSETEESKEKPVIFFLEPEADVWHTDEPYGCEDGDVAYVEAVFARLSDRRLVNIHESSVYLFGYGSGGTLAQMAAMWNPAVYAGLCTIDATVSPAYMEAAGRDFCLNLGGFDDPKHRYGIKKGDIPLPVWLIDGETPDVPLYDYWKRSNHVDTTCQISADTISHTRTAFTAHPYNEDLAAHTVWESHIPKAAAQNRLPCRIWKDFLNTHRRWMGDPGGNLRMKQDPVLDLGAEYHFERVEGWLREWYTYVPDCVKSRPDLPVPLVFACHGYTCNGAIYMENSGWHHVADDYGFIVVFPTAGYGQMQVENAYCSGDNLLLPAWNIFHKETQPEEFPFFRYLINRTAREYPIDRTRVFVTGHSLGSLMVQMLGLAMPECFAAIAPCSGVLFDGLEREPLSLPEVAARQDLELPVWMFAGSEEAFLVPDRPEGNNRTAYTINAWLGLNHMKPKAPTDWTQGWKTHDQRWQDLIYQKNGVPLVGFTRVEYMPHATMEEMSRRIWAEFFTHFARRDGRIIYCEGEGKE